MAGFGKGSAKKSDLMVEVGGARMRAQRTAVRRLRGREERFIGQTFAMSRAGTVGDLDGTVETDNVGVEPQLDKGNSLDNLSRNLTSHRSQNPKP